MKTYIKFIPNLSMAVLAVFLLAGLANGISSAEAQSPNLEGLISKLNRLERDIQTLNRQVYKGNTPSKSSANGAPGKPPEKIVVRGTSGGNAYIIRIEERLSQLEGELQNSTNTIESVNHTLDGMKARLDKLVSDIDFRLSQLESGAPRPTGGQGGAPVAPPTIKGVPRAPGVRQIGPSTGGPVISSGKPSTLGKITETDLSSMKRTTKVRAKNGADRGVAPVQRPIIEISLLPKGTPAIQYKHAFSILRKTDYDKAELAFIEFIQKHPKDKLTPNARYWLGKTYFVRAKYPEAMEAFFRGFQQAPKGPKAPDTLLMLGLSLSKLNKKSDACATFSKLAKDYPDASANIKKQLKREIGRTGCK